MAKRTHECHLSTCKHVNSKRTPSQNNALHKFFELVADALNGAGWSKKKVLELYFIDLDWDTESVKSDIWKPVQRALIGKSHTAQLKKQQDIDRVYEHVNRFLGEKLGVHVPFPNNPDKHKEQQYISAPKADYPTEECGDVKF